MNRSRFFTPLFTVIAAVSLIALILGSSVGADAPPPMPTPTPIDVSGSISEDGTVTLLIVYSVLEGQAVLSIDLETKALTDTGDALHSITVVEECFDIPPVSPGAYIIGCAYDYTPNGATFTPEATLTLKYDSGIIPAGIAENELVIACYDTVGGRWIPVPSVADTISHVVTAQVSHFSMFAVYGATGTPVTGITRGVDGSILSGVSITINGVGSAVSAPNGQYEIISTVTGNFNATAHKDGYRDKTQNISITGLGTTACNFQGNYGLIPNAPNMQYALFCINRWLYPPDPGTRLTMQTALNVINAWLFPR